MILANIKKARHGSDGGLFIMTKTYVIIPAAGQGRRFGALKQFQLLEKKPLLLYALEVFEGSPLIEGIHLMVPETELESTRGLVRENSLKKVKILVGGRERQDSVRRGFESLPPCDLVMVHDGARPFITADIVQKSVETAKELGACIVGIPVRDTTKRADTDHCVKETLDRSILWSIQTPQTFRYDIFQKAIQKAEADQFLGTDESMLVERLGVSVRIIEGSPYNLKVTTPEDLKIAEVLLSVWRSS